MTTLAVTERQAAQVVLSWREDPVGFVRKVLRGDPWKMQCDVMTAVRDDSYVSVRSCNAVGKDWLAARIAIWWLMCHEEAAVVTTAPSWHQVKDIIWREIHSTCAQLVIPIGASPNKTDLSLGSKRFAVGLSTDRKERFQGIHNANLLVIVSEASGMPEAIMDAIDSLMAGGNAKLLMIGNPTQISGTFFDSFHSRRTRYTTFHVSAFDTPNFRGQGVVRPYLITPEWVADKERTWGRGSVLWQAHVLGDFPTSGQNMLVSLALVEAAFNREVIHVASAGYKLGVDVARYGKNKTVFTIARGDAIIDQVVIVGESTMQTAGRVASYIRQLPGVSTAIDDSGVGGGVVDRLLEQGLDIEPVIFGAKANDTKRFANRASEMYWHLREECERQVLSISPTIPSAEELRSQLTGISYKYTSRGQIRIEKYGPTEPGISRQQSPDLADSVALCRSAGESGTGAEVFVI